MAVGRAKTTGNLAVTAAAAAAMAAGGSGGPFPLPSSSSLPSAEELALFTELQQLVKAKALLPVLHCVVERRRFKMPFDDSVEITLDTDVNMALPEVSGVR
jgi:hypothetical protein